ncbi:MAG: hypothetical protein WDW36_000823 [Sanguina aurantia]
MGSPPSPACLPSAAPSHTSSLSPGPASPSLPPYASTMVASFTPIVRDPVRDIVKAIVRDIVRNIVRSLSLLPRALIIVGHRTLLRGVPVRLSHHTTGLSLSYR